MQKSILFALLSILFCAHPYLGKTQCSVTIQPQGTCTGTAFTGQSITDGGTYISTGTNTISSTNITMSAGTLIVCSGTLTITSSQIFAGFNATGPVNIIINSGATLTSNLSNLFLYTNATLTNYGTLNLPTGGAGFISGYLNSAIVNTTSGVINSAIGISMAGTNSRIFNNGQMTAPSITVNATSSLCLGNRSRLSVTNLTNAGTNHSMFNLGTGAGQACLQINAGGTYTAGGTGNVISTDPAVRICSNNATNPTSAQAGSATVNYSCASCSVALPLEIIDLTAKKSGDKAIIGLHTARESNIAGFQLERSANADNFETIGAYTAARNGSSNNYEFTDLQPAPGDNYYRVKVMELDRSVYYTATSKLRFDAIKDRASIYPNPATDLLHITLPKYSENEVEVMIADLAGKQVRSLYAGSSSSMPSVFSTKDLSAGTYIISVIVNGEPFLRDKLMIIK